MATDEDLLQQELDSDPGLARAWFIFLIGNWNKVWNKIKCEKDLSSLGPVH